MSPTPRAFGLHASHAATIGGNFELACFEKVARTKRPDLVRKLLCKATVQEMAQPSVEAAVPHVDLVVR